MFVILLRFADRNRAVQLMAGHNAWIDQGFEDGVFLLTGSLQPGLGGAVVAHNCTRPEIELRVSEDPLVAEGVVNAEIHEVKPGRADPRLAYLAG